MSLMEDVLKRALIMKTLMIKQQYVNIKILTVLLNFIPLTFVQHLFHLLEKMDSTEKILKTENRKSFISQTSLEALRLTITSILNLTRDLLDHDFNFVLTGKFNQDCIEVNLPVVINKIGFSLI